MTFTPHRASQEWFMWLFGEAQSPLGHCREASFLTAPFSKSPLSKRLLPDNSTLLVSQLLFFVSQLLFLGYGTRSYLTCAWYCDEGNFSVGPESWPWLIGLTSAKWNSPRCVDLAGEKNWLIQVTSKAPKFWNFWRGVFSLWLWLSA